MPESTETVNTETTADSSPAVAVATDDQELFETVPEQTIESIQEEKTNGDTPDTTSDETVNTEKADETTSEEKESDVDLRFSQSTRFQQMNDRMKTAEQTNTNLSSENDRLRDDLQRRSGQPNEEKVDFFNSLGNEEIMEALDENPIEFLKNFKNEIETNVLTQFQEKQVQQTADQKIDAVYERYAEENPSFKTMLDDGSLRNFVDKNPGHTALSAHVMLDMPNVIKGEVSKAVQDKETEMLKNFKAKRQIDVLPSGPTVSGRSKDQIKDPALQNPKAFGGTTAVLAQRLLQRRRSSA